MSAGDIGDLNGARPDVSTKAPEARRGLLRRSGPIPRHEERMRMV